jgi:uncharacterized OsmC-like protein
MISRERLPITGISSAPHVNVLRMRYLGIGRDGTSSAVDREELRAVQAPLKERYREDADTALLTLRADGELGGEGVSCSIETGRALVEAGLHPYSGGDGSLACSGDMLLQALVACAGVTLRAVAVNLGLAVGGRVLAEGDLDFRGTMGVDRDAPVGFQAIRLSFELETDASEEELETLLRLTERYCVVFQTLAGGVPVGVSHTLAS